MRSRHLLSLMLLFPFLMISCASTTEPNFVVSGDNACWDLELSSQFCQWPFPSDDIWNRILTTHYTARIEFTQVFPENNAWIPRMMDEGSKPSSPGCGDYDPPSWWIDENFIDSNLVKVQDFVNENTQIQSANQRIRFLVFSHRSILNKNFPNQQQFTSGNWKPLQIFGSGFSAIRNVAVVYVDDLHRYHCIENKSYVWLTQELLHTALHEMGHVSTDQNDLTAQYTHGDDPGDCCALRSPSSESSACRKVSDQGYCGDHLRAIANRRFNNENR